MGQGGGALVAWLDDRVWCHPKVTELSDRAFRVYVSSIAYSAGMKTRGFLEISQQKLIGSTAPVRLELVNRGLWELLPSERVYIHDWDEHNGAREARKEKERLRLQEVRRRERERDNGA